MKGGLILDIQKLIDDDATWLKQEITFEKVGEYYEITTPYLDNANLTSVTLTPNSHRT